ncbi:LysR family transcriptional regulator [Paraburkholderia sp. NMBU_R16]|uniref:TOBE domain-containing protein n=1 Tax=Paraburkholderia sp. NMBU_R16 TaxID=2698676 RepID=UPI001564F9C5|nr:TOBE domain-containing protein [Paraburkholderia sp. NMBU_R16]NRO96179.1 LysR family transcriptional regulator [Paraburkholderia sp. NMBU_R16]
MSEVPPSRATPDSGPQANARAGAFGLGGSLWLSAGGETLAGAARIALLAAIRETGSITGAAKAVGISYKAAWDAIDAMNNLAGVALVVRATGGKGGGGTTLTPRGERLIETFRAIEREHRKFIEHVSAGIEDFARDWALIGRIGMRTSARNQLVGTIVSIAHGAVNDEVTMKLPGGQQIVAVITRESTETLGLTEGATAYALVKASWVMLAVGNPDNLDSVAPLRLSARNQLHGRISQIVPGAVNAEVSLVLDAGAATDDAAAAPAPTVVTAVVTNESVRELGLSVGMPAIAAFKASSVILGTDG